MGNQWDLQAAVFAGQSGEHANASSEAIAEICDAGSTPEENNADDIAAVFRSRGCSALQAAGLAQAVLAWLGAKDKKACGPILADTSAQPVVLARAEALESLRLMAVKLVQAPKPRFSAGCFLLAAGFDYEGIRSERDWAQQQKVSPTLASNEVRDWQRVMKLPKTSGQKSEKACKAYADSNGARKKEA